jgi:hypothetical protein
MSPSRAVEDDHVDRPGVEAWRHVKLTGTNSSIDLIALINPCPPPESGAATDENQRFDTLRNPCFAGLVAMARGLNPIPFRTRPLNPSAPMVLRLKTRESRSLPGLQSTEPKPLHETHDVAPATHTSGPSDHTRTPRPAPVRRTRILENTLTRGGAAR